MMFLLKSLSLLNTFILRIGRHLAWIAIGLMVVIILVQVLFRYGLNSALPWPDEAARFLMLWMTGLIAPSAYRWGGFVSIEMLLRMFHPRAGAFISLLLLMISLMVLVIGLQFGWKHVNSGWLFASSSLKCGFTVSSPDCTVPRTSSFRAFSPESRPCGLTVSMPNCTVPRTSS